MAVASSILAAVYRLLRNGGHLRGADKTKSVNRLLRTFENLGLQVAGSGKATRRSRIPPVEYFLVEQRSG